EIDTKAAEVEDPSRGSCRASEHGTNSRRKLAGRERFDDVVVGAELEPHHTVRLRDAPGQQDHRHIGRRAYLRQHVEPAHRSEVHVEYHEACRTALEILERGVSVPRVTHGEALAFESGPDEP